MQLLSHRLEHLGWSKGAPDGFKLAMSWSTEGQPITTPTRLLEKWHAWITPSGSCLPRQATSLELGERALVLCLSDTHHHCQSPHLNQACFYVSDCLSVSSLSVTVSLSLLSLCFWLSFHLTNWLIILSVCLSVYSSVNFSNFPLLLTVYNIDA